jgi:hypothetical protein
VLGLGAGGSVGARSCCPPLHVGDIDMVSAGAVNNAFLATLLWLPHTSSDLRTLDDDIVELDNLNRCLQFRASDAEHTSPRCRC